MREETFWRDRWGDLRIRWFIAIAILIICVLASLGLGLTYAVQGCFINKGHLAPHIEDGIYEYEITEMTFPRSETSTFYLQGRVDLGGKIYSIRANESLGEQAWSQGVGGYVTIWVKNNHIIKYHTGRR